MKKLFLVLAVASLGFVACNNDAESTDAAADSIAAKAKQDSIDAENAAKAQMQAAQDTLGNKIDSVDAKIDSLKKN